MCRKGLAFVVTKHGGHLANRAFTGLDIPMKDHTDSIGISNPYFRVRKQSDLSSWQVALFVICNHKGKPFYIKMVAS